MKKLVILALLSAVAMANPNGTIENTAWNGDVLTITEDAHSLGPRGVVNTQIDFSGIAGQDGKDGSNGSNGTDGSNGSDGTDGSNGSDGKNGNDGKNGKNGNNGSNGQDGADGSDGSDGSNGNDGVDGSDGSDGSAGTNGTDGTDGTDFNAEAYKEELSQYYEQLQTLEDYTVDAAAGAVAVATIDFGTTEKGVTEVGAGFGVSSGRDLSTGYAGAVGIKYGMTDEDAAIAKGWVSGNSSYGVGVGVTHRF